MADKLSKHFHDALVSAFQDVDVEKTGVIKTSELRTALQLVGQNPSAEEVTQLAEKAGSGQWTLEDFLAFVATHVPLKTPEEVDAELMDAFDKFAEGEEFLISREEFRKVMTKLGDEPLTEQDADALLTSLASLETPNGMLNVAELAKLFMG